MIHMATWNLAFEAPVCDYIDDICLYAFFFIDSQVRLGTEFLILWHGWTLYIKFSPQDEFEDVNL